ncbi:ArsR family transcriptional regulator, partial [Candidatus Woesearchaeota archaeon]|nr:ArsR family transcriptional regulator [Candidatus Woesearchaeota archaeon]
MEVKLTILKPFFEDPNRKFSIRELSRILKINHTTVRQYLNRLVKE